jgi:hypothetical protein
MFRTTSRTLLRAVFALAVLCSWPPGASIGQTVCAAAALSTTSVAAGTTSPPITLITNGTVDLGNVTPGSGANQFGIKPNLGITFKVLGETAQYLRFSMDIPPSATPGTWTLFVNDASNHEVVALNVVITPFVPQPGQCNPPCQGGLECLSGRCVAACNNTNCPPEIGSCQNGKCVPH